MRPEMKKAGLLAAIAFVMLGHPDVLAEEPKKIRDNSFLIEEAYNQEPGVIQHIQTFLYTRDGSWIYTFTEEWPVPKETHQLSATVPVSHIGSDGAETGIGDVLLNYRYQAVLKGPIAVAPRLSLILPTGNNAKGLGDAALGYQVGIPASIELADRWVTHWNLGATYIPDAKGPNGIRRDLNGFFYGASLICLLSENFNLLVEAVGSAHETFEEDGSLHRENSFFINPGLRFALNFKSGLQVVPGISMPIGVGPSEGERGVFVYLSLEHPLF
jgi:hypothetical protein